MNCEESSSSTTYSVRETKFKREIERLKTFEDWRVPFLSASQMAKSGFYFTKKHDIVRCAFCNVEVGSWEEGDDVMFEHQLWSPTCKFVCNLPVGNLPISVDTEIDSEIKREYGIMLKIDYEQCGDIVGVTEKLNIIKIQPAVHPEFSTLKSRIESFATWPISLRIKSNELSEAGFFYTGRSDRTICYYCGGGLKDWIETDIPWVEHAKWFNKCGYLRTIKGSQYADDIYLEKNGKAEEKKQLSEARNNENVVKIMAESSSSRVNASSNLCKICFMKDIEILFLPCAHFVSCSDCSIMLNKCAICRQPISAIVRAFLS